LIIMCGWRQIIKKEIRDIPRLGMIGFHPTLLPAGRGSAPIINTILEGWGNSGVTMFYPDDGIDSGDIIDVCHFDIEENDYAIDVYKKCTESSKELIIKNLKNVILEKAPRIVQDESKASYFKKIYLEDNEIDLWGTADEAYKKIKAFSYPYLGAYIKIGGKKIIIERGHLCTEIKK
jgi:methionyl-tRNA formyltransferase